MDPNKNGLLYEVGLTLIPGVGDVNGKRLIAWCGSAEAVFRESSSRLRRIPGIGEVLSAAVRDSKVLHKAEQELAYCMREQIRVYSYLDASYPVRLKECEDGPNILYVRGDPPFNTAHVLAMVGTRKATSYGLDFCQSLLQGLAGYDVLIVSGLAYGIDAEAHRASLANGLPTVAVLAHGLDRLYPYSHHRLSGKMLEKGGLVTEFMRGESPERINFPRRNRIIAGMSDAIIVVEAAETGGALITADIGNSYNRDVFALPGRVGDTYSVGCLNLIRDNKAAIITSSEDLTRMMNWEIGGKQGMQVRLFPPLDPIEQQVMDILVPAGAHIDTITLSLSLPPGKVSAMLLEMEFKGLIRVLPGNHYAPAHGGKYRSGV